ncbi:MAG: biotin/lipoyl-binding protein [Bacteroidetes bacterium]|nr:biotin/lipoyl-binding protein [Bacteroidota bacterium]MBU1117009.1 biotin/lipoyl-binding protein [Bacteroidota bacterium]MBU1799723.1 biotin/lipoyl-binding protein [Bacteroidota bacterium]
MKKFKFNIRGNEYNVEIVNIEDDIAEIEVNGSTYQVEVVKTIKEVKTPKLMRPQIVPSGGSDSAKTSKPSEKKGVGFVKAPLPGTILEVKVKVGDVVKIGDNLLIMEAMKMENDIRSDKSGKVSVIKVNNGDSVLEGDVLVEIGE